MQRKIVFYKTDSNRCQVKEFLDKLPSKVAQKVVWVLKLIEDLDRVPSSYFKKLEGTDIWECRIKFASNTYRILGFFTNENTIILTHGFMKKTEKIPQREIEITQICKKNYLSKRREEQ